MALCANCGTNNVDGTKFCVNCGATLAPAPGAWRAGTDELSGQPTGPAPGNPTGPATNYPPMPAPPVYAPPAGAMFGNPPGGMAFTSLRYAEWLDRVAAALIDGALVFALMIVLYIVIFVLGAGLSSVGGEVGEALGGGVFCIGMLLATLSFFGLGIYNKVYLVSKRGFSIGQGVMNLKVVDAAGNIPSIGTLILRLLVQLGMNAIPFVGLFLVILDLLWPLWDEKKQTLHDKAASTFVIKTA